MIKKTPKQLSNKQKNTLHGVSLTYFNQEGFICMAAKNDDAGTFVGKEIDQNRRSEADW